jgi:ATP-dependent DNA helicase DinG
MLPIMRAAIERDTSQPVLMQGEAPRSQLIEQFTDHGDAVLVATMSFWQGVDVPGSALRLVIIDKLPFASPGDPVMAARLEYLRSRGQDPFQTYQVPQAALLLRQGFGRLIRRKTDRGLVAILDKRVVTRGYGAVFLRSLPGCPRLNELEEAQAFLANGDREAPMTSGAACKR